MDEVVEEITAGEGTPDDGGGDGGGSTNSAVSSTATGLGSGSPGGSGSTVDLDELSPHEPAPCEANVDRQTEEIIQVMKTGDPYKLDILLNEFKSDGWDAAASRDHRGLALYVTAIEEGFLDVVNMLLLHHIPLGDSLIRCIDERFDDGVRAICRYLSSNEGVCKTVLEATADNDDIHPAITAIILAAQLNNFEIVKMLVDLGAVIEEPTASTGADVSLLRAASTIHVYRALSQPAYIMATERDIFGQAFKLSKKLRELGLAWEDFGAEFDAMADSVDTFAGDLLGSSASTEEVLALFRFHKTDKYRDAEGKQHPLAKVSEAIMFEQKNFIAHPHSQKLLIYQFYQNLLSFTKKGAIHGLILALSILLGYPVICLVYILFPIPPVVRFVRIPYVMMVLKLASSITFIGIIVALGIIDRNSQPLLSEYLRVAILLWNLGMFWTHTKMLWKHGGMRFMSNSTNKQEMIVVALYLTIFFLQWDWNIDISFTGSNDMRRREAIPLNGSSNGTTAECLGLRGYISSALDGLTANLTASTREEIGSVIATVLSERSCSLPAVLSTASPPVGVDALPLKYQSHLAMDAFDPILISETLYGVAMVLSILRLTNLLMLSETLGPLRISIGSMSQDFMKFLAVFFIVWFAFAVGMTQNYHSPRKSATLSCLYYGGTDEDCGDVVAYTGLLSALVELYWALFGFTEIDTLELAAKHSVAEITGIILFACYLVVGVLILLNALIGMLSNTYNIVEEDADTEWKFNRAIVWDLYLHPVGTLPPPFNLIPSVKTMWRCLRSILGWWLKCARRPPSKYKPAHAKLEYADYTRTMKLISSRYVQDNLSPESRISESVSQKDLKQLKNDISSLRYFTQNRMENVGKTLSVTGDKCDDVHRKLNDLNSVDERADHLNVHSSDLKDRSVELKANIDSMQEEIDRLNELLRMSQQEPQQEPQPESVSESESGATPEQLPVPTPTTKSSVIRRVTGLLEQGNMAWGDNNELRQEITQAVTEKVSHDDGLQMKRSSLLNPSFNINQ